MGELYIVATPIGNLQDVTLRALDVLKEVDCIAAEDTRHSRKLLNHFGIDKPMLSVHEHNEKQRAGEVIKKLSCGQSLALISDAGTPLISDPGYQLVKAVTSAGYVVRPIPGVCAAIAGLSVSGLATDRFHFEGFLPQKSGNRLEHLRLLSQEVSTLVFYEAPHRIEAFCSQLISCFGEEREAVFARELTKSFETINYGNLSEQMAWLKSDANQQRGEFVVMIEGYKQPESGEGLDVSAIQLMDLLLQDLPPNRASQIAAKFFGKKKKVFYDYALTKKS
ncbi:MAG: 16S rRNA (cytidine(1402)-2'-O)-methyltransferase [Gammaproteobacteria bacterium]|nr:16S rRNA (cytidine(1402)-2'-O)-methyltransferase [Gammaproteobacteria bacterium]